jgi:YndJ-like protein
MAPLVNVIVMTGMLVIVPMGLRLIDGEGLLCRWWWVGALPGAVSLWLPRGRVAAGLATAYGLVTLALAVRAPARLVARRTVVSLLPRELAAATALATPAVAGVALVAERAAHPLLGFRPEILALTVAHFHYAGFAAALVAGLVCQAVRGGPAGQATALSVPGGTLLVLTGFFTGEWVELAGALVLTAGMWLVGLLTWRDVRSLGRPAPDRVTRALLTSSAVVLIVTMSLTLLWALGEATGLPHPSLFWMAATHGVGNAFGFALCGICAWCRLRRSEPEPTGEGYVL